MSQQRQRDFASSLVIMSVMIALMALGGGWGRVYGHSAGAAPTPEPGAAPPAVGGAEGEAAPARQEVVAGEEGATVPARQEVVAGEEGAAVPARQEVVAGEEGSGGVPSQLDQTGAESSPHWLLLSLGVILFTGGALMFMRTRRAL